VVVLQKRGRPPKPREVDYADFMEEDDDAAGLAPPHTKRKRAASAAAAASLEDQPLIGLLPSLSL
jgi:cohesin complex subunit SA-1/2